MAAGGDTKKINKLKKKTRIEEEEEEEEEKEEDWGNVLSK